MKFLLFLYCRVCVSVWRRLFFLPMFARLSVRMTPRMRWHCVDVTTNVSIERLFSVIPRIWIALRQYGNTKNKNCARFSVIHIDHICLPNKHRNESVILIFGEHNEFIVKGDFVICNFVWQFSFSVFGIYLRREFSSSEMAWMANSADDRRRKCLFHKVNSISVSVRGNGIQNLRMHGK